MIGGILFLSGVCLSVCLFVCLLVTLTFAKTFEPLEVDRGETSARPLALATISLVWAHEIIKAFAHGATANLPVLSCKRFISSFNLDLYS